MHADPHATPASTAAPGRFDRLERLVGPAGLARLGAAHVMVVGVGGVGSWAAEALARSGVGHITLVDFDTVCVTNMNRQLHALESTLGRPKAEVMAARLREIAPAADVRVAALFVRSTTVEALLAARPDHVIDAIDSIAPKCHLLSTCRRLDIPVVCATGSGGRLDPSQLAVADLAFTDVDPLARMVRKLLRQRHGFPREEGVAFGIPAVFSREPPVPVTGAPGEDVLFGSAAFVTGAAGLQCAALVVRALLAPPRA